ncbi:MAG TPA: outer membrane beta-barrel protein [Bacteroidia bacterium]|nr:outer membrane beta-barrel protein [Bacteroidia bacterium]
MNIGRFYGKVIDAKTKQPVEYASVILLWFNKDSLIAGGLAKENGDFSLEGLPAYGGYRLKISFIGYKSYEQKVYIVPPNKIDQDLGDIKLEPDEKMLKEVEVTTEKATFTMGVDRKIYNVDKDLSAKGGTALDAAKNIPTISIDTDGNVTLRESAVTIYVDGKPTTLTLQQIPADQIDRIEVISNPSVKFEASTTGGILNVVLKKNNKPGYNGMVMANAGTGDRYGGMANISIKESPFNLSLMYTYNQGINNNNGYTNRSDLYKGSVIDYFNQNNITRQKNAFNFARFSLDYNINNRNTITLAENFVTGEFGTSDLQNYSYLTGNKDPLLQGYRINNQNSGFKNYTTQLMYKKTYPKVGKELTIDLNNNYSLSKSWYQFNSFDKDNSGNDLPFAPTMQHNNGGSTASQYVFQVDYVNPINEKSKLEMGLRSYNKNTLSYNNTTDYNYFSNTYQKDSIMSSRYVINDMVNAAYVNYISKTIWDIGYQAGLRVEETYYKGTLTDKNKSFLYNYPGSLSTIKNCLFPGLYLSKKIGTKHEIQFNVSRKIERPNFFQAMPFVMFSDKKNYRIGNPALKPEFINIAEINYNNLFEKGNWLVSLYGRYSEQPITNAAYPSAIDSTILVNTFVNGKNSIRYGMENTLRYTFFKKLTATANVDVFYVYLTSGYINNLPPSVTKGWSYKGKITLSYSLPWQLTAQVNGTYEAPKVIINGWTNPYYFMDISLNKMISTKWVFNLTLSDVFNTKRMGTQLTTDFYTQTLSRRRETRYLKFTVSYLFGKFDSSIFKNRGKKGNNQDMSGQDGLGF